MEGVSYTGKKWVWRTSEAEGEKLGQALGVSSLLGRVLAGRGVKEGEKFLEPKVRDTFPDPFEVPGMERAATRVREALAAGERVGVFMDYDVDGATSGALLTRYMQALGVEVEVYVPQRDEGYGPSVEAMRHLLAQGAKVIFTLDCGTAAQEVLQVAVDGGAEVVILDHHGGEAWEAKGMWVVNPYFAGWEVMPAAVGVVFLFLAALNRVLREGGWFAGRTEPNLMQWLDLVALGTVCDVMALRGFNRAWVHQGLKVLRRTGVLGLQVLMEAARVREANEGTLGFVLGPRLNAAGRLGRSRMAWELLTAQDKGQAQAIAHELDTLNAQRQRIEATTVREALAQVEKEGGAQGGVVVVVGEGWPEGVLGLVAGRVREHFNCVALASSGGRGSGRSVEGVDLGVWIREAVEEGILVRGGGHAMAVGFELQGEKKAALEEFLRARLAQAGGLPTPVLELDAQVGLQGLTGALYENLAQAAPYGAGNPSPCLLLENVRLARVQRVGKEERHVRCTLQDGFGAHGVGMVWRADRLGEVLRRHEGEVVRLVGHIQPDRAQALFIVQDVAACIEREGEGIGEEQGPSSIG